jgi:hypothetical protein
MRRSTTKNQTYLEELKALIAPSPMVPTKELRRRPTLRTEE